MTVIAFFLGYGADVTQSACYSLTGGGWKEEAGMLEKRESAASSIWPGHGLLVTGGYNLNRNEQIGESLSSTEYLSSSRQWTPGPALPDLMLGHCQVTAGSDVIIAGNINHKYQYVYKANIIIVRGKY